MRYLLQFFTALTLLIVAGAVIAGAEHNGHNDHHGHKEHDEPEKGLHGGRLLEQGDVAVELAIFEKGVPPQFRAWIYHNDQPVDGGQLQVHLTRLGGDVDTFHFTRQGDYWLGDGVVEEPHSFDVEVRLKLNGEQYQWSWQSHEGRTHISEEMAEQIGITTAVARSGVIKRTLTVFGNITVPAGQIAHVRARFPGMMTKVQANIGDTVKAGQALAQVEANESLKQYTLNAPIDGVIIERHAIVGESAQEQALFTIADLNPLWAELNIFPSQRPEIAAGQEVVISTEHQRDRTTLLHLLPTGDNQPFVIARAQVANDDGRWSPGLLIKGDVTVETAEVPLVVDNRALQPFRDWTVVFVQVGDAYEIRPLELGRSDGEFTEVLAGLNAGDRYVVRNSYLIKADIEKSGAAHVH